MSFCSPFDAALAQHGPAAVFLLDTDGLLRFEATWTRDAWGRAPGPHALTPTWLLARDLDSGFVWIVFVTSDTLLAEHPRLDLEAVADFAAAEAAVEALGSPPMKTTPW